MSAKLDSLALNALLTAAILQALDLTIATVALPSIERSLDLDFAAGTWILTSYLVAMALMTPVAGALSAGLGRRPALLVAIGGLTTASVACGLANSLGALLAARLAQGAAAGLIIPLVQATLLDVTPKDGHGRAMSLLGAALMVGPVVGPSIGGVLVELFGWRSVFFINLPIGLYALIGAAGALRDLPRLRGRRFDAGGLVVCGSGIVALQLLLDRGNHQGWFSSSEILTYAVIAAGGLVLAVLRAARRRHAFPSLEPFGDRNFTITTCCSFLAGFVVVGSIMLVPSLLQSVFGEDAAVAGIAIAPRGVGTMIMMLAMSRTVGRIDHRRLLLTGAALIALALLGLALATASWGVTGVAALSLLQGVGVGLVFTPLSTAAFTYLPTEQRADATGLYSLMRNVGGSVGVSVLTAVLVQRAGAGNALISAYRADFLVLLAVTAIMAAAMAFIRTDPVRPS